MTLNAILPRLACKEVRGNNFCTVMACHTQGLSKKAQLSSTFNCSCLCSLRFVMSMPNTKTFQNSVEPLQYGEQPNAITITYLFKNKFKASNTLLNSAEYTITTERVFLFSCVKIVLGHSNGWTHIWCTLQLRGQSIFSFFSSTRNSSLVLSIVRSIQIVQCYSDILLTDKVPTDSILINDLKNIIVQKQHIYNPLTYILIIYKQ